ncbi:zinc finger protein 236-like [Gigantopelta aegis]|uniref:zinc finger protein 236-like n=1 Tax=Gigantopelta aegis TaxID=1735272 RepID=UPI001B88CA6C|nr:zinc finger protein 236-like [Gigantopelta aegis]XP_041377491.1 zinc finger protein 236-like [Gigantopelta aegis]XP_041377492.1 zinc finger protein 236-like [Gigantopelta aegis]
MDQNVTMLEVNPAQMEVLESLMQLRNEEPNTQGVVSVPIQDSEEAVQTSIIQMDEEVDAAENQMVTIVPMEDVQSSDKMVTFIAVDEMGNRVHLPDDVVTFVSVDDDGNTIQLECNDLTEEQMQVIQVGMDLEAAQQEGAKMNIMQGSVESIEVYKCDLCRQVFTKRTDWDDHECPGQPEDDQEALLQPLAIQLEQRSHVVIKEEDDSTLECNLCRRTFALRENWEQHMLSHLDKIEARPNSELEMKQLSIVDSGSNAIVLSAKTGDVEYRCDACGKRYQEKSELEKHLVTHIVDKFYECPICSNAFATKFSLRKHVINHLKGKGKPFKCELCEKAFNQKVNLRAHMSVHTGLREFKCHICHKEFSLKGNLNKHIRIHTDERPFKCNICGRSFKVKEYLIQHRLTHSNELPFACGQCGRRFKLQEYADRHTLKCDGTRTSICEQCGMTYATRGDLNRHIDEVHPEMKPYQCGNCSKRFKLKSYLQQHELSHSSGRNWVCGVCKKDFKCRHSLRQHLMWHTRQEKNEKFTCEVCGKEIQYELNMKRHMLLHSGNMPFSCEVCSRGFPDSSHLRRHMMRHLGEKPHKCELCGKGFYTTTHLKRHVKTHSSLLKPFACSICGKGFVTEEKMQRHFETHYGAVKGRFKCRYCDKACNKRSDLSRHTLIHTGEKPYKCDVCGMAFRTSTHRKRHLLTHTTEKPFKCSECHKAFKSRDVLKKHEAIHKEGKSGWKKYCPVCGKGFKFVFKLREHEKLGCKNDVAENRAKNSETVEEKMKKEEQARPHKCAMCNRSFKSLVHLGRHEATHKEDEGDSTLLNDDDDDDAAVEEMDEQENELQCKLCSRQFEDSSGLEKHKSYCKVKPMEATTINYINKKKMKVKGNQCSLCGKVFVKGSHALKQHISLMHTVKDFADANSPVPDSFYKCKECGKLFAQPANWKKHLLTHKEEGEVSVSESAKAEGGDSSDKPHKCGFCSISFRESTNLVKHLLALHYKKPADSTIPGAFTAEVSEVNLEAEEGKESEAGEGKDKTAAESDNVGAGDENQDKPYKCDKCPKQFGHITFLNKHILAQHPQGKEKSSKPEASKKTASEYSSTEFPFSCNDCGAKIRNPTALSKHKESLCQSKNSCEEGSPCKSPERRTNKHGCNICDSVLPSTAALLKHMRKTHKHIKFPCFMCGKGYPKETGLKQHITLKHGEPKTPRTPKPATVIVPEPESRERKFTCDHCHKSFRTESQLKRHIPTHKADHTDFITDIKKEPSSPVPAAYSCESCEETFHLHSELRSHMLAIHVNDDDDSDDDPSSVEEYGSEKDFEIVRGGGQTELSIAVEKLPVCRVCDEWFSLPSDLSSHMASVHGEEDAQKLANIDAESISEPTDDPQVFACQYCDATFSTRFKVNRHEAAKHEDEKMATPARTRSQQSTPGQNKSKLSTPVQKQSKPEDIQLTSTPPLRSQSKSSTPSNSATPMQKESKLSTPKSTRSTPIEKSTKSTPVQKSTKSTPVQKTTKSTPVQKSTRSTSSQMSTASAPVEKQSKSSSPADTSRSGERSFRCCACKREFRTVSQLNRHERTHEREDDDVGLSFKCETCGKAFAKSLHLKKHMSCHSPSDVKCEEEAVKASPRRTTRKMSNEIVSDSDSTRRSPRRTATPPPSPMKKEVKQHSKNLPDKLVSVNANKCNICSKLFTSIVNVKLHLIKVHNKKESEVVLHKCSICKKKLGTFWDLKKHKLTRHRKRPVESEIMKEKISEKIKKSIYTPSGERITKCDVCGGWFPDIKLHMESHEQKETSTSSKDWEDESTDSKKTLACNICGKSFAKAINLKMHKMVHKTKKGGASQTPSAKSGNTVAVENIHECAICGKEFLKSSSLKVHVDMKHGEYHEKLDELKTNVELDHLDPTVVNTCEYCQNDFPELSAWYTHKLTQCGEGMPQCICCDKMFKKTWNLKIHYFRVHNIRTAADIMEQGSSRLAVEHTYCRESGMEAMQCPHCPKKFTAQQRLRQHLKTHKRKGGVSDTKSQEAMDVAEDDDAVPSSQETSETLDEISITLPEHPAPDPVEGDDDATAVDSGSQPMEVSNTVTNELDVPSDSFIVTLNDEDRKSDADSSAKASVTNTEGDSSTAASEGLSVEATDPNESSSSLATEFVEMTTEQAVVNMENSTFIEEQTGQTLDAETVIGVIASDADINDTSAPLSAEMTYDDMEDRTVDTQTEGNIVDTAYTVVEAITGDVDADAAVYVANCGTEVVTSDGLGVEIQTDVECESSVTYYEETVSDPNNQMSDQNELYEQALSQLIEGEKRYMCEVCNRQCATTWSLKQHMETHGVTAMTEQSFAHMLNLVQTGNNAPYKCEICSRTFSKSSQLTRHKATHKEQQQSI